MRVVGDTVLGTSDMIVWYVLVKLLERVSSVKQCYCICLCKFKSPEVLLVVLWTNLSFFGETSPSQTCLHHYIASAYILYMNVTVWDTTHGFIKMPLS